VQPPERLSRPRAKRADDIAGTRRAAQVALLGRGAAALERAWSTGPRERAGGVLRDDGRLVEPAFGEARAMQRHRQHEIGQRAGLRKPRGREQQPEQPPRRELVLELERAHPGVDRKRVAKGRDDPRPRAHPQVDGCCLRQVALATFAEVERRAAVGRGTRRHDPAGATACEASGRKKESAGRAQGARDRRLQVGPAVDRKEGAPEHAASLVSRD